MRGSLREKIGEGGTADIHVWAPGQVVKLFKAGVPRQLGRHEARVIRAVFAAGVPAPEVLDEVTWEGRFGIVLQRLDGPTLLQLVQAGAMKRAQAGAILATLHMSVHKTPPPSGTPTLLDWFDAASRAPSAIPKHISTGALALIERLPPGDGLCHGDLHPSNVIMTSDGPKIIDWAIAMRAAAAVDLARCHVILSDLAYAPDDLDPEQPRAFYAALQSEYARLAGMSPSALAATTELYLPILRAFTLAEVVIHPARRAELIQRIEAALPSEDE